MEPIIIHSTEALTTELVSVLVDKHKAEALPRLRKLKNYYIGKHDILTRQFGDKSKPNNRIVNPFPKFITDMISGYFMGKPISYTSSDELYFDLISTILSDNDEQSHNSLISKDMSIYGIAFELLYTNEQAEIKFTKLPVEETFMVYGTGIDLNPIGAIRHYTVKDYVSNDENQFVEVYTDEAVKYYKTNDKGQLRQFDEKIHFFGQCPVIPYYNNDEERGDFEPVLRLIDSYDIMVSDAINDSEYMADSYLHIKGVDLNEVTPQDFTDMKNNRLILTGDNGDIKFVTKQSDTGTIQAFKKDIVTDIHKFSSAIDINSDSTFNAESGISLRYKVMQLETLVGSKERLMKKAISDRIRMVNNILSIRGLTFEDDSVSMQFTRNLPINESESVQLAKELYGLVSQSTLLSLLPMLDNPHEELEKIKAEREESLDGYGFKQ